MNTPLILMAAVAAVGYVGWLMARSGAKHWRTRHERLKAEHAKLFATHLNSLGKLWASQEAEQRRQTQRMAALDKAHAANRAARAARL